MNALARAEANLAQVEENKKQDAYCCEHAEKADESAAKKEVKRWQTWLADHAALEGGR